ncbi:MAG: LLM class flavin-dependent oxidoreductase [Actinomycetota bacterium]|nr:LLM class flavin-dependent oxidoreductase [Actinomycetota bacterium]
MATSPLRFGVFIAPHHPVGEDLTLQYERDLQLCQVLDQLGYDEVWVGEHHSGGWETIGHPEMFLAAAAQRTGHIQLATGVTSLPYHHPYNVAGRITFLDHLSRGRAILGTGPGALPSDARAFGIDTEVLRDRQDESIGIIKQLLSTDDPLTYKSDWFEMQQAHLQVKPYRNRTIEMVAASSISPSGMKLAGKHGLGVISVASYSEEGLAALPTQWGFAETYAAEFGNDIDRSSWRVMMPWHIAETREQAIAEVKQGLLHWHNGYNVTTLARAGASYVDPENADGFIEAMIARGGAIIGTPDDAVAAIGKLSELTGGFGTLVGFMHDWANHEATLRSYDMFMRYVVPKVQQTIAPIERAETLLQADNTSLMEAAGRGILKAIREHNATHPRT